MLASLNVESPDLDFIGMFRNENWEYGVQKWNQDTFGLLIEAQIKEEENKESEKEEVSTRRSRRER